MRDIQDVIADCLPSAIVRFNEPMAQHTSFEIGGPADILLTPGNVEELVTCLRLVHQHRWPFFLLGGGTNILVADRGIRGVVISLLSLNKMTIEGGDIIAEAGATVESVCQLAAENGLSGVEFINGMPGTIGGAAWMNARCYGGSIADVLVEAKVITRELKLVMLTCTEEQFGYKRSPFQKSGDCIFSLRLRLTPGDRQEIGEQMEINLADRTAKGHFTAPSAGSLFKNNREHGAPAGQILDELGLRGTVVGGAAIAPYHGNIFINQGGATADDVLTLIRLAVEIAKEKRGILLEPEVRLVGDWRDEEISFLNSTS